MRLYTSISRSTTNFIPISVVFANAIFFSTLAFISSIRNSNSPPGIEVTPNKILKDNCNVTPEERRDLALKGESATENEWKVMSASILEQEKKTSGVYALHVSKSGGEHLNY